MSSFGTTSETAKRVCARGVRDKEMVLADEGEESC